MECHHGLAGEAQSDPWPLVHFAQVSLHWCCPHVQKQTCTSGSSWEAIEEETLEVCVLIESSSSLQLCSGVPGLLGRTPCVVPLGLPGRQEAAAPSGC